MKQKSKFFILIITAIFLISGCKKTTESDTNWGSADFTSYVAIGNSLTAGVSDGALYKKAQKYSFPNLIAKSAGVLSEFEQPLMSGNGFSFDENEGRLSVDLINFSIDFLSNGSEENRGLNRAFNNLGIPLIRANQVYNAKTPDDANGNHFIDKILRNSGRTQIQEALSLDPTFITLWIGNNDVLEAASTGLADERYPYTDSGEFEDEISTIVNQLTNGTDAPIVIANLFDLIDLPFFSSLPSEMNFMNIEKYLYGECEEGVIRELTDDDIILFWALPEYFSLRDSTQYPDNISVNTAFNDTLILDKTEIDSIINVIAEYNEIIVSLVEQNDQLYLADIYELFKGIANDGYDIGGLNYTDDLVYFDDGVLNVNLTASLFSYDALHPNQNGYLAIANTFIDVINMQFNANLEYITHQDLNSI